MGSAPCIDCVQCHDALWEGCGFQRRPDITTRFSWRDLDDDGETEKTMTFWIKELR